MDKSETAIMEAVQKVEAFYQTLTGNPLPNTSGTQSQLLPEKDPENQIVSNINRFIETLKVQNQQNGNVGCFVPPMKVYEREKDIQMKFDIPGVQKSDIQIEVTGSVLVIKGERQEANSPDGYSVIMNEDSWNRFERTVQLPNYCSVSDVAAKCKDGVVIVQMTKQVMPTSEAKKVAVK